MLILSLLLVVHIKPNKPNQTILNIINIFVDVAYSLILNIIKLIEANVFNNNMIFITEFNKFLVDQNIIPKNDNMAQYNSIKIVKYNMIKVIHLNE